MNHHAKSTLMLVVLIVFATLMLGMMTVLASPSGTGTLGDFVWFDANADGLKESATEWDDSGIDGVLVNLYLDNGTSPGVFDSHDALQKSITTGDDPSTAKIEHGWYDFVDIGGPLSWWVEIADSNFAHGGVLEGYEYTGNYTDVNPYNGDSPRFVYIPTNPYDHNDADFGFTLKNEIAIGNLVWDDLNKDSAYTSASESGIGGVTVKLFRDQNGNGICEPDGADGTALMTTTTMITVTETPIITAVVGISNPAVVTTTSGITTPTNITFTADIISPTIGLYQFQSVVPSDDVTNTSDYSTTYYCVAIPSADLTSRGYLSSSNGGNHAPDTNDGIDDGTVYTSTNYVVSQPFRASKGGQSDSTAAADSGDPDGYADTSSYMTVDFGFIQDPNSLHLTTFNAHSTSSWPLSWGAIALVGLALYGWRRRH